MGWQVKRKKLGGLLFLLGILGAASFYVFFVLLPMREEAFALRHTLAAKRAQLQEIRSFLNAHVDMAGYEKEARGRLAVLESKVPDELLLDVLVESVEAAAKEAGVALVEIKPSEETPYADYAEVPLRIKFRGDYWSALSFSKQLAQLNRFLHTKSFSLKAEENGLLCKMECNIFYYRKVKLSGKQEKNAEMSNLN